MADKQTVKVKFNKTRVRLMKIGKSNAGNMSHQLYFEELGELVLVYSLEKSPIVAENIKIGQEFEIDIDLVFENPRAYGYTKV